MNGYTDLFNHAISNFNSLSPEHYEEIFSSFRIHRHLYGFIDNGDLHPDMEADFIAKGTNIELYDKYKERLATRKDIGYGNTTPVNSKYNNLDSRHIMMFCILFTHLPEKVENIIEIGAGYGNWLFLNKDVYPFKQWTCIDLPHLLELQRWCYNQLEIPHPKLISAYSYTDEEIEGDLVIGSHSLSEFSYDVFFEYFNRVVKKCKYLFYAHHNIGPTLELNTAKLNIINEHFKLICNIPSEGRNVSNRLYVKI